MVEQAEFVEKTKKAIENDNPTVEEKPKSLCIIALKNKGENMPKPKKPLRMSVKRQIEETPQIQELEDCWFKNLREKLAEAALLRLADKVYPDLRKTGKISVHTHTNGSPQPSIYDLIHFGRIPSRTMVIAAINPKGEVIGYTFIKKSQRQARIMKGKPAMDYLHSEWVGNYLHEIANLLEIKREEKKHGLERTRFEMEKEEKEIIFAAMKRIGWKIRFVPMKGFEYDSELGLFVHQSWQLGK